MTEKEQTMNMGTRIPVTLFAEVCNEINDTNQTKSEFVKEAIEEKLDRVLSSAATEACRPISSYS